MRAEIVTTGTELLLGQIDDTNATYLARQLRDLGVDLFSARPWATTNSGSPRC